MVLSGVSEIYKVLGAIQSNIVSLTKTLCLRLLRVCGYTALLMNYFFNCTNASSIILLDHCLFGGAWLAW